MTHGMLLGKFLPPTQGHAYLVDFARASCDKLTVLVCTLPDEPIPGAQRAAWMREMFPRCDIVHYAEVVPQTPEEHPRFWDIWRRLIRASVPGPIHRVFASEAYGERLAAELGAEFVPVDLYRRAVPVSARAIRADPMAHWRFIPPVVRPYYLRRVRVVGPESTGKSTLTAELAAHFGTCFAEEYARPLLEPKGGRCDLDDIPRIARGQRASEDALARQANRVLFCDTDLTTTVIWSELLFGECPDWIRAEADAHRYDLTLLLDVDVPWVDDNQRHFPERRRELFDRFKAAFSAQPGELVTLSGDFDARRAQAIAAVEGMLRRPVRAA
ncbi:AAA family ATPase [Myxococcota bacterium]|nr:AAA family ATPase [Myxococcota bacterium]